MPYDAPQNQTRDQIDGYLRDIYARYPEYHTNGFDAMVDQFAADDFYKGHLMAQRYKELTRISP